MASTSNLALLARLACGAPSKGSVLAEVLASLHSSLSSFLDEAAELRRSDTPRVIRFGPFVGRSILELVSTSLIARIDPFRVLALREVQAQPNYEVKKRTENAIQWTGDVMIKMPTSARDMWTRDYAQMSRALLGDYQQALFWKAAYLRFLDLTPEGRGGEWVRALRLRPEDSFIPTMRTSFSEMFTECSKGVHHELLVPPEQFFSTTTVRELLERIIEHASILAAVVNSAHHVACAVEIDNVVAHLESLQAELEAGP